MAGNKALNMKVNFTLDTGQAKANIKELYSSINQITKLQSSSASLGINTELQQAVKTAEVLKQTLASATDIKTGNLDLSKFTNAMNQNMMTLEKFKSALTSLGPEGEKVFDNLSLKLAQASVPIKRTNAMMDELKTTFANTMRWQLTSTAIHKVTQEVQKAFNYAQNLDKSLNRIQIVTGHSADYMKNFAVQANNAAKALSASTLEYTNAALIYYQQGLSDKEVQKRTDTTIKMAKVSGEAASTVSQQMTAVWNNFSNGLDNLERYADVMTALGATTASSSAEIAKGLEKFAGISKTIGLSYDYAASALATVTAQTRQSADSVGTAFKTLFSRLESLNLGDTLDDGVTLNKYSEALMKVGVNVLDVNGQLKNMDTILDELGGRWDYLNQAQQVALAQTIGGVRNYTSLITLMDNWEKFQTNVTTAQLSEGTLQKQADIYAQSWEAAQQRVTTSMQTIYSSLISSDFFKGLNNITAKLLDTVGEVGKTLGSSGTFSALHLLANQMYGTQFANGINNLENNLLMNTRWGKEYYANQQAELLGIATGIDSAQFGQPGTEVADERAAIIRKVMTTSKADYEAAGAAKNATDMDMRYAAMAHNYGAGYARQQAEAEMGRLRDINTAQMSRTEGLTKAALSLMQANPELTFDQAKSQLSPYSSAASNVSGQNYIINTAKDLYVRYQAELNQTADDAVKTAIKERYGTTFKNLTAGWETIKGYGAPSELLPDDTEMTKIMEQLGSDKFSLKDESGESLVARLASLQQRDIMTKTPLSQAELEAVRSALDQGKLETANAILNRHNQTPGAAPIPGTQETPATQYTTLGQVSMMGSQALNMTNMATNSMKNFAQSVRDGTANFAGLTTTVASSGMALHSWNNMLMGEHAGDVLKGPLSMGLGKLVGGEQGAFAQSSLGKMMFGGAGKSFGLTQGGLGAIMLGLQVAGTLISEGVAIYKANTKDAQISRANEDRIAAASQAKEEKQKYDSFMSAAQAQVQSVSRLTDLQKGTAAYTSQLIDSNNQARELISTYNLTDYTIDSATGAITFTAEQLNNANEQLLQSSLEASTRAQLATSKFNQLTYSQDLQKTNQRIGALRTSIENANNVGTAYVTEDQLAERQQELKELETKKANIELQQQVDYQTAVASVLSAQETVSDTQRLAADVLGMNADEYSIAYTSALQQAAAAGRVTRTVKGQYKSEKKLRKEYQKRFGEAAEADMKQADLAAAIESKIAEDIIQGQIDKLVSSGQLGDASMVSEFSNYKNLSFDDLKKLLERTQGQEGYEGLSSLAITSYGKSIDNLTQAVLNNTNLENMNITSILDAVQQQNGLSVQQIDLLTGYVNNYGTVFGESVGKYIYDTLLGGEGGAWNAQFYDLLQQISADSSIGSFANLEQMANLYAQSTNTAQAKYIQDMRREMLKGLEENNTNLTRELFMSSGFADVMTSLSATLAENGMLTAQDVLSLAKKNGDLSSYLSLNGTSAAAVADIASLIATGELQVSEISTGLANAINAINTTNEQQQEGLNAADRDWSTSYTTIDKDIQEMGKIWYTALKGDYINDAPLNEVMSLMLSPEELSIWNSLKQQAGKEGKTTDWFEDQVESQLPDVYDLFMTLQGKGKKKGKGGGGARDLFASWGERGFFENFGFDVDEDTGKIEINGDWNKETLNWYKDLLKNNPEFAKSLPTEIVKPGTEDEYLTMNSQVFEAYLRDRLQNNGKNLSTAQIDYITSTMMGNIASTGLGAYLAVGDTMNATQQLRSDLEKEGFGSLDALQAFYNLYAEQLSNLKVEDGKLVEKGEGEQGLDEQAFLSYIAGSGAKLISSLDTNFWQGTGSSYNLDTVNAALLANQYGNLNEANPLLDALLSNQNIKQYDIQGRNGQSALDYEAVRTFMTDTLNAPKEAITSLMQQMINNGQDFVYNFGKDLFGNDRTLSYNQWLEQNQGVGTVSDFSNAAARQQKINEIADQRVMEDAVERAMGYVGTKGYEGKTVAEIAAELLEEDAKQAAEARENSAKILEEENRQIGYQTEALRQTTAAAETQIATTEATVPTEQPVEETTSPSEVTTGGAFGARESNVGVTSEDVKVLTTFFDALSNVDYGRIPMAANLPEKPSTGTTPNIFDQTGTDNGIQGGVTPGQPVNIWRTMISLLSDISEHTQVTAEGISSWNEEDTGPGGRGKQSKGTTDEESTEGEEGQNLNMPTKEPEPTSTGGGWTGGGAGGSGFGKWSVFGVDDSGNPIVGRINPSTGEVEIKGEGAEGGDTGGNSNPNNPGNVGGGYKHAAGQNNHLLAFATGASGHIAVTGELGPELRIKQDGSADLLGKKGREYAWVEPTDKIYTATQTAGILGRNNISTLDGLAKGLSNYIPGYAGANHGVQLSPGAGTQEGHSSSGGGGGGSGGSKKEDKDDRYDPNTLKIRDVLERYYTILQKIDDITKAVERFSKVADRAWGKDRIKAIEKQTELYQKQYDAQKKYVSEIGEYLNTDEAALTTMIKEFVDAYNKDKDDKDKLSWAGAEFDSNGVLTNYREFVEKLTAEYNKNAEANAKDKKAQYKFQEQLKDIQFYTDTLNTYEAETDKLIDLANQIIDSSLKEITYRVEYELELNNDLERVLDFKSDLVKDNVFKTAEYLALLDEEMQVTADNLSTIQEGVYDYLGTLAGDNLRNGKTYTTNDLGITKRVNGVNEDINYDDINFEQVTKNLDDWLEELRSKDAEAAEEVDKIIKRGENGLIENYREIFDKINAMNQKLSKNSIELLQTNVQEFFNQLSSIKDNPMWSGLTTEQKDQLTNYMEQTITELNKLRDQFKNTIESLGDSLKDMNKKIGSEIDEFGYYGDVYQNFLGIINLTNRHMSDISNDFFKNLNSKVFDNNINKIKATNTNLKLQTQNLEEVNAQYEAMIARRNAANAAGDIQMADFYQEQADLLKDQLDIANKAYEDAMKDFQTAWKDALEGAKSAYEDAVKEASRTFEDSFSPFFHTLELLEAQYAREKALGDLYVDDYQRIHDLSKLNRDIENSILDTDNIKSKERLRELQKEINDLQDSGVELSEYDLDILDKKYKLELARQALEDARDAKSLVRLSRDNNGNWGYVYTSNEDEVAEAEQNYEDAIREMEEANENYIENLQDQMLQVQKDAQQAVQALNPEDFGTWDEYMAAIKAITDNANQTLAFLASQMNNALDNNEYLNPFIENRYGINDHNLTTDYADTPLAKLLGINSLDQMTQDAFNRLMDLGEEAGQAWHTFQENQEQIFNAADHDIAHIGEQFTQEMETVAQQSQEQVETVEELADRIRYAFADTAGQVTAITDEWVDSVKDLTDEYSLLLEVITELKRLDGEYVEPTKMINADEAIDSWKEISDFKKNLAANGVMSLLTTNDEGIEFADTYIAGSAAANQFIKDSMEAAAKKEAIDVGGDLDSRDEYNKIIEYLKKRGVAVIKIGDEFRTIWSEDDEWLKKKLKEIEDAEARARAWSGGYGGGGGGGATWHIGSQSGSGTKQQGARSIINGTSGYGAYVPATILAYAYQIANGDTGMYTGRWQSMNSGGYTGEWPMGSVRSNGRLAFLHQKELVLNAHDTENFLDAMEIVRQLDNLTNWMANGLGDLFVPSVNGENGELEQNVHIEASFPNVTDHNEIEMAFDNLVNRASQYANRK